MTGAAAQQWPTGWMAAGRPLSRVEWTVWTGLAIAIISVSIPTHAEIYQLTVPIAFVLGFLQGGSVLLTALLPKVGALAQLLSVVGLAIGTAPGRGPWPMPVIGMIALAAVLVALGLYANRLLLVAIWSGAILILIVIALAAVLRGAPAGGWVVDLIVTTSCTAFALVIVMVVAQLRTARAETHQARQEIEVEHSRVLWVQERSRIAREMHDVVAHSMSLVHMRATSARFRLDGLNEEAAMEFDGIADQARSALREMRGLLGVLREDGEAFDAPQPRLADLEELIASTQDAGVPIAASLAAFEPPPSAAIQLALYRVAQEALSNVIRHAPGASAEITLELAEKELVLQIHDTGAHAPIDSSPDIGGHGIRGMMERMASVNGTLAHYPDGDRGYLVVARVPQHPGHDR